MKNYQDRATNNLNTFCNNQTLKEKRQLLLYISKRFAEEGIEWCLTCSSTLFFRGIKESFNDFDILIDYRYITKAIQIMKELKAIDLPKGDQSMFASTLFNRYQIGNVKIDLFSEWRISAHFTFTYAYSSEDVDVITIEENKIQIVSAETQMVLYSVLTPWQPYREEKVVMLKDYLNEVGRKHPKSFDNQLPADIIAKYK